MYQALFTPYNVNVDPARKVLDVGKMSSLLIAAVLLHKLTQADVPLAALLVRDRVVLKVVALL
jgi:hypothetical protein